MIFALEDEQLIQAFKNMDLALSKLTPKEEYAIRKKELKDQEQMAHIKVDGWRTAHDRIVAFKYLNELNYEKQAERYIRSFEEYKNLVLVAVEGNEVLGYSCFDLKKQNDKYDSELVSFYIKPDYTGKGIGSALFKKTVKELLHHEKKYDCLVFC